MAGKAMQIDTELSLSDFDFDLPRDLIAQYPLPDRAASRLLRVVRDELEDRCFNDLESLLRPGDLLVLNEVGPNLVFGQPDSEITLLSTDGATGPLRGSKDTLAHQIWDEALAQRARR